MTRVKRPQPSDLYAEFEMSVVKVIAENIQQNCLNYIENKPAEVLDVEQLRREMSIRENQLLVVRRNEVEIQRSRHLRHYRRQILRNTFLAFVCCSVLQSFWTHSWPWILGQLVGFAFVFSVVWLATFKMR